MLDQTVIFLVLGLYVVGCAILVRRVVSSRPGGWRRIFYGGELALLPENWRRWLLDEKQRPSAGESARRLHSN